MQVKFNIWLENDGFVVLSPWRVMLLETILILIGIILSGCAPIAQNSASAPQVLRLATTTSTADSGLLDAILPNFEAKYNANVEVVAVGTGQALEIGSKGDADVVLVHARVREEKFVTDGDGVNRQDVMYNDFVIVGPSSDPAGINGLASAKEALTQIAETQSPFASRGDNSGTHSKEKSLWASTGITPSIDSGWYLSLGQGMGETLLFSYEKLAYTLTDRGTWLSMNTKMPGMSILIGGTSIGENKDKALLNPYGVIAVNPEKHPGVNFALANQFIEWLTSPETQTSIGDFGKEEFGQSLFYPNASK